MNQYLMLLHESPASYADVSPAEMQQIVADYAAWAGRLAEAGRLVGGEKLADDGGTTLRHVAGQPVATDGPYAETHDVVGGYFVIQAANEAEARSLAFSCPHLSDSRPANWIELRRIEPVA